VKRCHKEWQIVEEGKKLYLITQWCMTQDSYFFYFLILFILLKFCVVGASWDRLENFVAGPMLTKEELKNTMSI
jgi:hypothetical protein